MKNVKLKIKNEGEDGKWGNEDSPMVAGCWAGPAQCGVRNAEGGVNTEGDRICRGGKAEFEVLRLKTDFRFEGHPEGWTPNGEEDKESITRTRTKSRNDEGMAIGALCLFVPADGCGGLGSPGKSAVAAKPLPAQSTTMWAALESWRGRGWREFELRGGKLGMSGRTLAVQSKTFPVRSAERRSGLRGAVRFCLFAPSMPAHGLGWLFTFCHNCSHSSAVLIIKIIFPERQRLFGRDLGGGLRGRTRQNSLKLARTLILKFF